MHGFYTNLLTCWLYSNSKYEADLGKCLILSLPPPIFGERKGELEIEWEKFL